MVSDSSIRYGFITRFFHWLMAIGFAWMFLTVVARFINEDAAFTKAVFAYHAQVGFTLLWLGVLRVIWAVLQRSNRPKSDLAANLGHACLYVLMIAVPLIALLRTIGSDRGFTYWGVWSILQPTGEKIEWMRTLGNTLHGNLGWLLFALIIGHIFFAIKHSLVPGDERVLSRIIGK